MKKNAFTLAEVLITLGIIGIVAALTLPSVVNNIKSRELHTSFKKCYSVLSQVVLKMREDMGDLDPLIIEQEFADGGNAPIMKEKMRSYLNCAKIPQNGEDLFPNHNNRNYKTYNNAELPFVVFMSPNNVVCATADGMIITLFNWIRDSNSHNYTITVDLNGYNKGPNRWGYDLFTFAITPEKSRLVTSRQEGLRGLASIKNYPCTSGNTGTSIYNGAGCSYYALNDTNPDNPTKGYWENLYKTITPKVN